MVVNQFKTTCFSCKAVILPKTGYAFKLGNRWVGCCVKDKLTLQWMSKPPKQTFRSTTRTLAVRKTIVIQHGKKKPKSRIKKKEIPARWEEGRKLRQHQTGWGWYK